MFQRLKRGGWPYSQPPNVSFEVNEDSEQAEGLVLWMPWGGGTPGAHSQHVDRIKGLVFTEGATPVWVSDGERGWSMLFDRAQSEYLENTISAPVTAAPLTLAAWVYIVNWGFSNGILCLQDSGGPADWFDLRAKNNGVLYDANFWVRRGGALPEATSTASFGLNAWHHICGVEYATNSRAALLDGGNKGVNVQACTPTGINSVSIGRQGDSTAGSYTDGRIMDVRVYNVAKTDAQVQRMYANPWELWRPKIRRLWAMAPVVARIPRPPAAYNTLAIY